MSFNYVAPRLINAYINHFRRPRPAYVAPQGFPWKKAVQGAISAVGAATTYSFLKKN